MYLKKKKLKNRRFFTILEIMVAIALVLIASGVIGVKMYRAVERKRFHSQIERFQAQLCVSQKLATTMQADWKGVLKKEGDGWVYRTVCEEENTKKLSWIRLNSMEIYFNGKKVDEIGIDFFASGEVWPEGNFRFVCKDEKINWTISDLFQKESKDFNSRRR